ncbi:hypothetical protein ACQKP0_15600 [Heyndrickxia sp. NPDC080065]|uniref:hypothetical protein n=1 Tax=Heyndrickxia sp. NPDC080065 TaxID=3390568 RepID=UPI003D03F54D
MQLANKLNFPIVADPLSQLRRGIHNGSLIIDTYDSFLRNENTKKALKPNVIIRFGVMPVSKPLTIFIKENSTARQVIVDGGRGRGWRDPTLLSTEMVHCDEVQFCKIFLTHLEEIWYCRLCWRYFPFK